MTSLLNLSGIYRWKQYSLLSHRVECGVSWIKDIGDCLAELEGKLNKFEAMTLAMAEEMHVATFFMLLAGEDSMRCTVADFLSTQGSLIVWQGRQKALSLLQSRAFRGWEMSCIPGLDMLNLKPLLVSIKIFTGLGCYRCRELRHLSTNCKKSSSAKWRSSKMQSCVLWH